MDFVYFGVIDIVLVLLAIIMAVVGFKKGFMKKLLSHIGILVVLVVSFFYASQFANMLIENGVIAPSINETVLGNINEYMQAQAIPDNSSVSEVLSKALGVPAFLSDMIINGIGADGLTVANLAVKAADYITGMCMNAISFGILAIGLFIILFILKVVVGALRKNGFVRFLDGLLGIVYHIAVAFIFVSIVFFAIERCMGAEWFKPVEDFLVIDMQLDTDKFRLSKVIFEGNILSNIFDLFLGA